MKAKSLMKSGRGIIFVALATLAPVGVAHATFDILGNKAADPTPAPTLDRSQYDRLEILGNVHWVPKSRGAAGPMRSDSADQDRMTKYEKLDILGNVFWIPKSPGTSM